MRSSSLTEMLFKIIIHSICPARGLAILQRRLTTQSSNAAAPDSKFRQERSNASKPNPPNE